MSRKSKELRARRRAEDRRKCMLPFYELKVSAQDLGVIAGALQELPHKMVRGVLDRLQEQVTAQENPPKEPTPPEAQETPRIVPPTGVLPVHLVPPADAGKPTK